MKGRKTLEINPEHPIVQALKDKVDSDASGAKVSPPSAPPYLALLGSGQELRCHGCLLPRPHESLQALAPQLLWLQECIL